ncbi:MAG: 6,7-dimethyl-8-ribityllumazine synthase [Balneolaceae bacterium]
MDWKKVRVGVIAAKWNSFVTDEMLEGAVAALKAKGIGEQNIVVARCPGSYELPLACKYCLETSRVDGVVAIGAVIRGGTPHFDYVCDAVNRGIMDLNIRFGKPVSFGVLTTDNVDQAVERASLGKGNKGAEAALALCDMLELKKELKQQGS